MVQCNPGRTHVLTLMIVDDERMTRESLAKYVAWSTVHIGSVRTARNGIEALAMADQDPPEILLTDVRMPRMNGLELAARVKTLNPYCKVVFLSGYADKEYLKEAIHLQAVSYVEKPVDLEEVKEAVRMAVAAFERDAGVDREEITRRLVTGDEEARSLVGSFEPHTSFTAAALRLEWSDALEERERPHWRRKVRVACGECAPFNLATSLLGFVETDVMAVIAAKKITQSLAFEELLTILGGVAEGAFSASVGVGAPGPGAGGSAACLGFGARGVESSFLSGKGAGLFPLREANGQVLRRQRGSCPVSGEPPGQRHRARHGMRR